MRSTLFVLGLLLVYCVAAQERRCECEPLPPSTAIEEADFIFLGTCTFTNTNWISGGWKFTFEVEQSWKRSLDRNLIVNTGWEETDCGYLFEEGQQYLVYVRRKFTPKTDRCMGTKTLDQAAEDLKLLGPGSPPRLQSPQLTMMYYLLGSLGLLSLLLVAFIVLRKRIFYKSR